ncbi:MAG: hypothetical protein JWP66_1314, partial [Naasia sp.]|nr:hypothetical protein [Naasia sp.]
LLPATGASAPAWTRVLGGVLPYAAPPVVALVPLGAALCLATSGLWGAVERSVLPG